MSQMKKDLLLDDKEAKLENKILRPLSAKLLPLTVYEEKGLIEREKLLDIKGRERKRQIYLAKKYKIKYPNPGGGCLLCEKLLVPRFKILVKRGLTPDGAKLINVGKHFMVGNIWIVIGRNEGENNMLKMIREGNLIEPDFPGPSAKVFGDIDKKKVMNLIEAYSKKGSLKDKKKWEKYKI